MGIASKFNKGNNVHFDFKVPKEFKYVSLGFLFQQNGDKGARVHGVNALYINRKGRFGDSPVAVTSSELVNLPAHLTDTVREMMADEELVQAVNAGKVGFKIYEYTTANRNEPCYSVNWVDID